jgi:hypothetical protein
LKAGSNLHRLMGELETNLAAWAQFFSPTP